MHSFESLGVGKNLMPALKKHGIATPTAVQTAAIPAINDGGDIIIQAETGSGKTLGFALPIIGSVGKEPGIAALVLAPTRELAIQIAGEFDKFSHGLHIGTVAVYGGGSMDEQIRKLKKASVVVATPGRLLDLIERRVVNLGSLRYLVFDEADRMLDMGFLPDIERIVRHVPSARQTLLFSATISKEIKRIASKYLRSPKEFHFPGQLKGDILRQTYYQTTPTDKLPLLLHLLSAERDLTVVFCNRKHIAKRLARSLVHHGIDARALQGDMNQSQRERTTRDFRGKVFNVLVATDVAARGLHIDDVSHVYNYEIPRDVDSFTHRVGRTARAGKQGDAISLVATDDERMFFRDILFQYNGEIKLRTVQREDLPALKPSPKTDSPRRSGGGNVRHGGSHGGARQGGGGRRRRGR